MNKKYYWLKLKSDFFTSLAMKKLRKIAGGDTYTIIYLKLQLLSLENEGILFYEGIEPTFYEEMALLLDEDADNVKVTLSFLESAGLITQKSDTEFLLTEVPYIVGSETNKAELMRKKREREKAIKGNNVTAELPPVTAELPSVTNCYTEKEIEKEIDIDKEKESKKERKPDESGTPTTKTTQDAKEKESKRKYGQYNHVRLKDSECEKLKNDFGYEMAEKCITFLDEYIEMKGYKANNHYLCIRKWVVDAVREREAKANKGGKGYTEQLVHNQYAKREIDYDSLERQLLNSG